jgi:peptide/nickel transport system permease protein
MSTDAAFNPAAALTVPATPPPKLVDEMPPSRSLSRQAMVDTLSRRGARIGLLWLGLLAFFAVFAPFLANTHPYLLKSGDRWSSPLLRHLTPADVLLLVTTATAMVQLFVRRTSLIKLLAIIVGIVIVAALPVHLLVKPPVNVDYQRYRDLERAGRVQFIWRAPIPYSPSDRLRDQADARLRPPDGSHWFGTDTNGADVASNILHASRIALSVGFIAISISVVIGIIFGGIMGYSSGIIDLLGMRFIEIVEAIPRLFLLIAITAFRQKRDIYLMMTVIGLTGWTGYARFIRAEFLSLRKQDFVQAALAAGLPKWSVLFRHMLPNALTPILVTSTFGVASAILYESTLSFLGLGLIDEASWGALLNQARAGGTGFIWWIATFPGFAIFLTVFAYNMVGEAVRDALDPKLRKRN